MKENRNVNAAEAAENTAEAIKTLLAAIGNDDDLKRKLEDALAGLTGRSFDNGEAADDENRPEPEDRVSREDGPETPEVEEDAGEDDDDDDDTEFSSGEELSDIFTEDAVAGIVVGFVVGAAAVGGGVLLHKLITSD